MQQCRKWDLDWYDKRSGNASSRALRMMHQQTAKFARACVHALHMSRMSCMSCMFVSCYFVWLTFRKFRSVSKSTLFTGHEQPIWQSFGTKCGDLWVHIPYAQWPYTEFSDYVEGLVHAQFVIRAGEPPAQLSLLAIGVYRDCCCQCIWICQSTNQNVTLFDWQSNDRNWTLAMILSALLMHQYDCSIRDNRDVGGHNRTNILAFWFELWVNNYK